MKKEEFLVEIYFDREINSTATRYYVKNLNMLKNNINTDPDIIKRMEICLRQKKLKRICQQ